jgi:hypothetical protein
MCSIVKETKPVKIWFHQLETVLLQEIYTYHLHMEVEIVLCRDLSLSQCAPEQLY